MNAIPRVYADKWEYEDLAIEMARSYRAEGWKSVVVVTDSDALVYYWKG